MRSNSIKNDFFKWAHTSDFNLQRFVDAQDDNVYYNALEEVRSGCKRNHWIWYIFPQLEGLGQSRTSKFYGLKSLAEAKAYLENQILRNRLYKITSALLDLSDSATNIFGSTDAMKVCSCMTLFDLLSPNDVFEKVLMSLLEKVQNFRNF